MKAYCTYCSALKDSSRNVLPAIKRYKSQRINSVYNGALLLNVKFYIFSGKYGLLHPNDEIPYYDHLLQSSEIEEHAKKVADQIVELGFTEILFYTRPPLQDNNMVNYIKCLKRACDKTNTMLEIQECTEF